MWNEFNVYSIMGGRLTTLLILTVIMVLPIVAYVVGSEVYEYVTNLHSRSN